MFDGTSDDGLYGHADAEELIVEVVPVALHPLNVEKHVVLQLALLVGHETRQSLTVCMFVHDELDDWEDEAEV